MRQDAAAVRICWLTAENGDNLPALITCAVATGKLHSQLAGLYRLKAHHALQAATTITWACCPPHKLLCTLWGHATVHQSACMYSRVILSC